MMTKLKLTWPKRILSLNCSMPLWPWACQKKNWFPRNPNITWNISTLSYQKEMKGSFVDLDVTAELLRDTCAAEVHVLHEFYLHDKSPIHLAQDVSLHFRMGSPERNIKECRTGELPYSLPLFLLPKLPCCLKRRKSNVSYRLITPQLRMKADRFPLPNIEKYSWDLAGRSWFPM